MGMHYTTLVLPATRTGADSDNAIIIIGAALADDIPNLPLPAALHANGNTLYLYGPHASPLGQMPVSDVWLQAAAPVDGYAAQARVCVVLDPLPEEAGTVGREPLAVGVTEPDLPSWTEDVISGRYAMAMRALALSQGSLALLDVALGVPTQLPEWAHHMHP